MQLLRFFLLLILLHLIYLFVVLFCSNSFLDFKNYFKFNGVYVGRCGTGQNWFFFFFFVNAMFLMKTK